MEPFNRLFTKALILISLNSLFRMQTAVFVSKKPYLDFSEKFEWRDSIEIEFNVGSDSIYAEIAPVLVISD